jgi:hypothetical protein
VTAETEQRVRTMLRAFLDSWVAAQYAKIQQLEEEGYSPAGELAPFHEALVPGIRGLGERGFSTALGNLHERVALTVAEGAHAEARRAFDLNGHVPVLAREFITQRIGQLQRREANPDHAYERQQLLQAFGDEVADATRIDLYIRTQEGQDHYFEIKSPKPNRGQCIEMKQRLLTALAMRRSEDAFAWWGVPYDPYGRAEAYAHPHPLQFFDFPREVKLGPPFWNFVGADRDTYETLLAIYREVGASYVDRLEELRAAVAVAAVEP